MAKSKTKKTNGAANRRVARRAPRQRVLTSFSESQEGKILRLIADPCSAPLTHGFALSTEGIVQRFTRFITPAAASENNFAYIFNPLQQTSGAVFQKLSTGVGAATNTASVGPGEAFIEANADNVATIAACMEVVYTGTLMNRKGYIGVCQGPHRALGDIAAGTTDLHTLLTYCQAIQPVGSEAVSIKYSPTLPALVGTLGTFENGSANDNSLMVVAIGVNPNDFVVRLTAVYEYTPKFALGLPAPRASKTYAPGAPERIASTLDRMGHWWHNVGDAAAAAYRMGGQMVYGAGQAARLASATYNTARTLRAAAVPLLALTG